MLSILSICKFKVGSVNQSTLFNGRDVYLLLMIVFMTALMALRGVTVGVDTYPYTNIFAKIASARTIKQALELKVVSAPVYTIICFFLSRISDNPQIQMIGTSLVINISLYCFIKKNSANYALSVFLWFGLCLFTASMNGNRQFMAITIMLNAMSYLADDLKNTRGWILSAIALGIHYTSIVCLLAVAGIIMANKIKSLNKLFWLSVIISLIISTISLVIINLFLRIFPRYLMYLDGTNQFSIISGTGRGRIIVIYLAFLAVCFLWFIPQINSYSDAGDIHRKLLLPIVFCVIFGIMNSNNELINRILWFFYALYITYIPSMINQYKGKIKLLLVLGIVSSLTAYYFISLSINHGNVVPYMFFWE